MLDLGIGKGYDDMRLIQNDGAALGPYVALSHCWGKPEKRPLTTTRETLLQRLAGIAMESLPQTFQDTVVVVKSIGLRYLWIDSLCIIQDDDDDWRKESVKMNEVFEKAYLTIAASHAKDSTDGLFCQREDLYYLKAAFFDQRGMHADTIWLGASWNVDLGTLDHPDDGALCKRAWVLQEWVLSRRIIFFTRGFLFWFCRESSIDETGEHRSMKWSMSILNEIAADHPESIASNLRLSTGPIDDNSRRQQQWYHLAENFSHRDITYATDRLMALDGLRAEHKLIRPGDSYILGHWKQELFVSLCWTTKNANRLINPLLVPSWAWPSVMGGVRWLPFISSYVAMNYKIISICPISAQLTIEGCLVETGKNIGARAGYYDSDSFGMSYFLDNDKDFPLLKQGVIFFCPVATVTMEHPGRQETEFAGPLVKKAPNLPDAYIRVGLGRRHREIESLTESPIRLIKII
jgi:Heterokaryon incompatibility protein (HET)